MSLQSYIFFSLSLIEVCFELFVLLDAFISAKKIKRISLMPFNKWYAYLIIIVILNIFYFYSKELYQFKNYSMPSGSMIPTLLLGDHIMGDIKYYKTHIIQRGDLVVFEYPRNPKNTFLKRAIGLPGEKIEIKNKIVYINNKPLKEPYVIHIDKEIIRDSFNPVYQRDQMPSVIIPKDCYFMMGDNRDNSNDSRFWGLVEKKAIKGKALYIFWPLNRMKNLQ